MSKNNRVFYCWCALIGGIITVAVVPHGSWIYRYITDCDSNRWAHFLAYALVVTLPFSGWRHWKSLLLSFIPVFMCIALETLQAKVTGSTARAYNVPADLFGVAAGVLLGLNIRAMCKSVNPLSNTSRFKTNRLGR
jgi:hypothetical protein